MARRTLALGGNKKLGIHIKLQTIRQIRVDGTELSQGAAALRGM